MSPTLAGDNTPPSPHDTPAASHDAAPLRERAWSLFCQGHRSPAIAHSLGVPERTIRGWLTAIQSELAADTRDNHHEAVRLAVARQLAIAASAWASYERVAAYERRLLDPHHPLTTNDDDDNPTPLPPLPPLHLPHVGARYLTIAMNAQREAARLQGLYVYIPPAGPSEVRLTLTRVASGPASLPDDQRAAWEAFVRTYNPFGQTPDDPSEFDEIADPLGLFPPPPGAAACRPSSSPSAPTAHTPPARGPYPDPDPDPDPADLDPDDDDDTATYEDALAEEPQDPADASELAEWTRRNDERLRLRALARNRSEQPAPSVPARDDPRPSGQEASPIPTLAPTAPPSPTTHPRDHKNRIPAESATPLAPSPLAPQSATADVAANGPPGAHSFASRPAAHHPGAVATAGSLAHQRAHLGAPPNQPTPPPNPDPDYGYPPPPVKIRRLHFPPGATFRPV